MNSGSGIQELMAPETRASQIVAEARIGQFIKINFVKSKKLHSEECCHVFLVLTRRMIIAAVTLYYYLSDVCEGSSILPSLMYSRLSLKHIIFNNTARGDRMNQAQTDADELITAYRQEQEEAFLKAAATSGKDIYFGFLFVSFGYNSTHIICLSK